MVNIDPEKVTLLLFIMLEHITVVQTMQPSSTPVMTDKKRSSSKLGNVSYRMLTYALRGRHQSLGYCHTYHETWGN